MSKLEKHPDQELNFTELLMVLLFCCISRTPGIR